MASASSHPQLGLYEVRDGKFAQMFHYDTAALLEFLERARTANRTDAPYSWGNVRLVGAALAVSGARALVQ
jgi:hypothetical protein